MAAVQRGCHVGYEWACSNAYRAGATLKIETVKHVVFVDGQFAQK